MVKLTLPRIQVNVKITLPSTFLVDGAQTIENEEYEETIKDVEECRCLQGDNQSRRHRKQHVC